MTPRRKSATHRTHADAERHPPSLRYSEEVSGSSDRSVWHSTQKAVVRIRWSKSSVVEIRFPVFKGIKVADPQSGCVCDAMGRDCFGLPQGTGLVRAQRMYLLLWVAVSLVGADRLAHARNRTPLPSSCSSSPRFATGLRTQLLHAADRHTAASAAVVVTTARDGCHAPARPMNHAAARLTLPGGCVMTSFLLHIESPDPDRHYQTLTKPSTCTVRSRRHGHSKASARAIRAGLDITAQGGWHCTCLHMSDSVPALSPIRS